MSPIYLKYLYDLGLFNIKLGLDNINGMLSRLGDPHLHPRIIHIAGTNGKGSTLAALERLLLDSGHTVGAAVSPHLISYAERFRINGKQADDKELEQIFITVCQACDIDFEKGLTSSGDGKLRPTFFEFSIAMAFALFRKRQVQYILLETGMGGRLDATNAIPGPLLCVLTSIGLDHQEYLGETIEEITGEKLGIVKPGTPILVAPQEKAVERRIRNFCLQKGVAAFFSPRDFGCESVRNRSSAEFYFKSGLFRSDAPKSGVLRLKVDRPALKGEHQKDNMATALAAYFFCVSSGKRLDAESIGSSLRSVQWPGRLQYLNNGRILLDGAHNLQGMSRLLDYLEKNHATRRVILAVGWMKSKNLPEAFEGRSLKNVIFQPLRMRSERAENAELIFDRLKKKGLETLPPAGVESLIEKALSDSLPRHDLLAVSGSLYLAGEFLSVFNASAD